MDSAVIDVAIGMAFTFAVVAGLSSVLTELLARFLGLRAQYLLLGLRALVDEPTGELQLNGCLEVYQRCALASWVRDPAVQPRGWKQKLMTKAGELGIDIGHESWVTGTSAGVCTPAWDGARSEWMRWAAQAHDQDLVSAALLGSPIVRNVGMWGSIQSREVSLKPDTHRSRMLPHVDMAWRCWFYRNPLRTLPGYLSARNFSSGVLAVLLPNSTGPATLDDIHKAVTDFKGHPVFTAQLANLLTSLEAKGEGNAVSVEAFRKGVENWYDDHMDRVSGWYKRHMSYWTLGIGAVLVVLLNINSIAIATTLFTDKDVREAVTALASRSVPCPDTLTSSGGRAATQASGSTSPDLVPCLSKVEAQLNQARAAGLPIGWPTTATCQDPDCDWLHRYGLLPPGGTFPNWQPVLILIGWILTILALVPGARFWFDVIGRLGSLRSTGPKPASTS